MSCLHVGASIFSIKSSYVLVIAYSRSIATRILIEGLPTATRMCEMKSPNEATFGPTEYHLCDLTIKSAIAVRAFCGM